MHAAPALVAVSHLMPQPPQLLTSLLVAVSQPARSGAPPLQLAKPALQLVYVHETPLHAAPLLRTVSHARPQPVQLVIVFSVVSQPSRSGAVEVQSPKVALQLVYVHPPAPQAAPLEWVVSHTRPQPVQFVVVLSGDSQPFAFEPLVSQSP